MTMQPHDMVKTLSRYRDRQFADLLVLLIGIAADTHPQELRNALGQVFDLSAVEETTRRMMCVISKLQAETLALKHDLAQLRAEADAVRF